MVRHFETGYLDSLMDELSNDIATSKSARVIIPVCHIYIEHLMNIIFEKRLDSVEFKKIMEDRYFGFKQKIDKLKEMLELSDDEYHDLDLINEIRNDFSHEFKPDLAVISKKIFNLKFHVYNENANPIKVILDDVITIMAKLEQKILN